jgi:hypothetical protein
MPRRDRFPSASDPTTSNRTSAECSKTAASHRSTVECPREHKPILAARFRTQICKNYVAIGTCTYDDRCMFAHGEAELRTLEMNVRDHLVTEDAINAYITARLAARCNLPVTTFPVSVAAGGDAADLTRPILAERFKTNLCQNYAKVGSCTYGARCMFAHGEFDLRTTAMNLRDKLVTEEAIRAFQRTGDSSPHSVSSASSSGFNGMPEALAPSPRASDFACPAFQDAAAGGNSLVGAQTGAGAASATGRRRASKECPRAALAVRHLVRTSYCATGAARTANVSQCSEQAATSSGEEGHLAPSDLSLLSIPATPNRTCGSTATSDVSTPVGSGSGSRDGYWVPTFAPAPSSSVASTPCVAANASNTTVGAAAGVTRRGVFRHNPYSLMHIVTAADHHHGCVAAPVCASDGTASSALSFSQFNCASSPPSPWLSETRLTVPTGYGRDLCRGAVSPLSAVFARQP